MKEVSAGAPGRDLEVGTEPEATEQCTYWLVLCGLLSLLSSSSSSPFLLLLPLPPPPSPPHASTICFPSPGLECRTNQPGGWEGRGFRDSLVASLSTKIHRASGSWEWGWGEGQGPQNPRRLFSRKISGPRGNKTTSSTPKTWAVQKGRIQSGKDGAHSCWQLAGPATGRLTQGAQERTVFRVLIFEWDANWLSERLLPQFFRLSKLIFNLCEQ